MARRSFSWRRVGLVACVMLVLAAMPGRADSGHHRDPGKVGLTAADAPDPCSPPAESSRLSAVVFVRKVDGLGAVDIEDAADCDEDRGGRRNHPKSFQVTVRWTVSSHGSVVRVIEKSVDVVPPLTFSKLTGRDTHRTGKFAPVAIELLWDGRTSSGQVASPDTYDYVVVAEFTRTHEHARHTTVKLIDESDPVNGAVTVTGKPAAPIVSPMSLTTNNPLITFSGSKAPDTAIILDGVQRVALNSATTWSTTRTLYEGLQSFEFRARSESGLDSDPVTASVTLDSIPPSAPVASIPPAIATTRTISLGGTKEPGTAVVVSGVVVWPLDSSTTWTADVTLQEGQNTFIVECVDAAGNRSLAAGSQQASISVEKPVIRDLAVSPPEITTGQTAQVTYRLFATVPPVENADLRVSVRVEAGDLLIKELFAGVQQAGPTGPSYSTVWDGNDHAGQAVPVNASYRLVVSAARVAPTTAVRELVDPNLKETAVLVVGSQHGNSPDKKLEIIFRPDDAKMIIKPFPALSPRASRLLTSRSLHPQGGCYLITVDRPFSGAAVGVLRCGSADGRMLRPFVWDDTQLDWSPVGRANWSPALRQLSFTLPRPGLVVFATTDDVDQPYVSDVKLAGTRLTARVRDDTSGVDTRFLRLRKSGQDISAGVGKQSLNGVHDILITLDGVSDLESLTLYIEDWAGHGCLFPLGERKGP